MGAEIGGIFEVASCLSTDFFDSIQQKRHWQYLPEFMATSTFEGESELPLFKYLHSHTYSVMRYERGFINEADITKHHKFIENA